MPTYKVKKGQNVFDIAVLLYGSIEGIYDLMISNNTLSMADDLKTGMELEYHDDFIINDDITGYFKNNNVVPINGQRNVYYKQTSLPLRCVIDWLAKEDYAVIELSGDGTMVVDWGDNSQLENITLSNTVTRNVHYFDNSVDSRTIRVYGNFNIQTFVASEIMGVIMPVTPIVVDEFKSYKNSLALTGLFLFTGLCLVDLRNSKVTDLLPIGNVGLQELNLLDCKCTSQCIDEYLIYVATHYGTRRNCVVYLSTTPSGTYTEPLKDDNGNYLITKGMEAIWVITHEESWNESGAWKFLINEKTYKYES